MRALAQRVFHGTLPQREGTGGRGRAGGGCPRVIAPERFRPSAERERGGEGIGRLAPRPGGRTSPQARPAVVPGRSGSGQGQASARGPPKAAPS